MTDGLQPQDVERILRDVAGTFGWPVASLRAEVAANGWRVVLTDAANRMFSTTLAGSRPAAVRAALTQWILNLE